MQLRWIAVTKRLPELSETNSCVHCLAAVPQGQVIALDWTRNTYAKTERGRTPRWEWQGKIYPWEPTHWMPYPDHPDAADQQQQPSPDLEPVRKLLRAITLSHTRQSYEDAQEWDREIGKYAVEAESALRSLLVVSPSPVNPPPSWGRND